MKVLILTCKLGLGHFSAAKAIQQKLVERYDGVSVGSVDLDDFYLPGPKKLMKDFLRELKNLRTILMDEEFPMEEAAAGDLDWTKKIEEVKVVDVFELAYPEYIDLVYKAYSSMVDKGAGLINFLYKLSDENAPSDSLAMQGLYNHLLGSVTKLLFKEQPDLIISAFSVCSEVISYYKELSGSNIPLITVITDIYPHTTWISKNTDYYLVAVEETKRMLITDHGVDPDRILVVGMPVGTKFQALKYQKEPMRTDAGDDPKELRTKPRRLLLMGGGLGAVPTKTAFYEKLDAIEGIHTTVVAAKNKTMYNKLNGKYKNITVLGLTDKVQELMLESDVLLTKSGGLTTFEAIYAGLPMAIFNPFLVQERMNAEFVRDNQVGIVLSSKLSKVDAEIDNIVALLFDESLLLQMRRNARRLVDGFHEDGLIGLVDRIADELEEEYRQGRYPTRISKVKKLRW